MAEKLFSACYITDPEVFLAEISKKDAEAYLYLDTETIGLFGEIRLVQLYQSHWRDENNLPRPLLIDTNHVPLPLIYREIKDMNIVGHNAIYDVTCFDMQIGPLKNWECTQMMIRLVNPELPTFKLDDVILSVVGRNVYRELGIAKTEEQKGNWKKELTDSQLTYAALDVVFLPDVLRHCLSRKANELYSYKLDKATCEYMLKFQKTGLPVSQAKLDEIQNKLESEIKEIRAQLPAGFNPRSYRQVRSLLGIAPDGESDDIVLAGLEAEGSVEAGLIRKIKKKLKLISFIDKFRTEDSRIYGRFGVGAKSGRSTCKDQNLQQIPGALKSAIESEKFLVYADFSNLELRTFAAMVGEHEMIHKFKHDEDLHSFAASKIFEGLRGDPKIQMLSDKEKRQIAKIFNFSSLYGAGVQTRLEILLKNTGIKLEFEQGASIAEAWLNIFPGVREWQQENIKKWRKGETGYTALKRPYKADRPTDFNNIQIQGSGAEVAKLAIHYCVDKGLDLSKLCVFIHDSYTFECDTLEEAKHYAEVLAHSMQEAWKAVGSGGEKGFLIRDLPMPVDAVVAHNWYDCQEDKNILYKFSC